MLMRTEVGHEQHALLARADCIVWSLQLRTAAAATDLYACTCRGASLDADATGLCDMADLNLVEFADALMAGATRQLPCLDSGTDVNGDLPAPDTPALCGSNIDQGSDASSIRRCEATRKREY